MRRPSPCRSSAVLHDHPFLKQSRQLGLVVPRVSQAVGVATGSDRPGTPQNHALFERNIIADNNGDFYRYVRDGTCARPSAERGYEQGVVCPVVGAPPGTGVFNPGGNHNTWRENWIYNNHHAGFVTTWSPGILSDQTDFTDQFATSHHNRYYDNKMGETFIKR